MLHCRLTLNFSLQFGYLHRIFARLTDPTEQRPGGDDRLRDILGVAVERHDMWHFVRMLLADRPPAEDTRAMRGPLAVPAVHSLLLTSYRLTRTRRYFIWLFFNFRSTSEN